MEKLRGLQCVKCFQEYSLDAGVYLCPSCGNVLNIVYDYEKIKETLDWACIESRRTDVEGVWKYRELLPAGEPAHMITLGEGGTPLINAPRLNKAAMGVKSLWLKAEFVNPTGSLKDRCSPVSIARALDVGAEGVCMVSSGNAGASLAAYAGIAGIRAYIIVPPETPQEKIVQMLSCGADVIKVRGHGGDRINLLLEVCEHLPIYNANTPLSPFGVEGAKTMAYEEYEQLGHRVPDWVVIPVGYANALVGHWKGYSELVEFQLTSKLPKIAAIQPEGSDALVRAYKEGKEEASPGPQNTIAGGLSTKLPLHHITALRAIRSSGGVAMTVSDEEILAAQRLLAAKAGLFVEPSGAAALAGVIKLSKLNIIKKNEEVVVLVTGSGFKDLNIAKKLWGREVPEIAPRLADFQRLVKGVN